MKLALIVRLSFCGFLSLAALGCGSGETLYPVSGKVTFPDGKPLTTGRVNFDSATHSAFAQIQPDGSYELTSIEEGDGVPAGTYKVYIVGAVEKEEEGSGGAHGGPHGGGIPYLNAKSLIAQKYGNPDTTPITMEVGGDNSDFNIQVEPAK